MTTQGLLLGDMTETVVEKSVIPSVIPTEGIKCTDWFEKAAITIYFEHR